MDKTHYDPVETGGICHDECAIAEIKRLRARVAEQSSEIQALEQRNAALNRDYGKEKAAVDRLCELYAYQAARLDRVREACRGMSVPAYYDKRLSYVEIQIDPDDYRTLCEFAGMDAGIAALDGEGKTVAKCDGIDGEGTEYR